MSRSLIDFRDFNFHFGDFRRLIMDFKNDRLCELFIFHRFTVESVGWEAAKIVQKRDRYRVLGQRVIDRQLKCLIWVVEQTLKNQCIFKSHRHAVAPIPLHSADREKLVLRRSCVFFGAIGGSLGQNHLHEALVILKLKETLRQSERR